MPHGKDDVIECVAEVCDDPNEGLTDRRVGIAKPRNVEVTRVNEVGVHDYVWSESKQGFYPVFGSIHGRDVVSASRPWMAASRPWMAASRPWMAAFRARLRGVK